MTNWNACGSVRAERARCDFSVRKREGEGRKAPVYKRSRKGTLKGEACENEEKWVKKGVGAMGQNSTFKNGCHFGLFSRFSKDF